MDIALIFVGGMIGAVCRTLLGEYFNCSKTLPFGTLLANFLGGILLGYLYTQMINNQIPSELWSLAGVGFCGAFTTYSTFSYEVVHLFSVGKWKSGLIYATLSIAITLFGIALMVD